MTRRQDARLEGPIADGLGRIVDAVLGALPDEARTLAELARDRALSAGGDALLELLAALGVDTSAHVTAPTVTTTVHSGPRRPGHDEDV